MKITAVVVARNEEAMIEVCLKSLKWADEILLVDNGSGDATVKKASQYVNKTLKFEGQDYAKMRNLAMEHSTGDWVLYVDADERVLASLKNEIEGIVVEDGKGKSAWALSRKNIIFGESVKYGPFWPDWVIRLFRKKDFKTWVGVIHEYGTFNGELGYLSASLLHLTHRSVDQVVLKSLWWSHFDAKLRFDAHHPKMSGWRFLRILVTELFYQGVWRRGFFSRTVGVIDSLLQTFSLLLSYIRLWEMQQKMPIEQQYKKIDEELVESKFSFKDEK